jgi:uncharacterized protein (TIGR02246 family)
MPSNEVVKEAIERYAAAVSAGDRAGILACFAADAVFVDPYPSPALVGREAIGTFWDNVFTMGKPLSFVPEKVAVAADRVAFNFTVTLATPDGNRVVVEGIEVAAIAEDGLIADMTAYWDPTHIRTQPVDN